MNKKYKITLTKVEKEILEAIISKGKYKATKLKRAYLLLGTDESKHGQKMTDEQISQAYRVQVRTVEKLRKRFVEEGFEVALNGKARKLRSDIKIDGNVQAHVIAISRSSPPPGRKRWTLQLIAAKAVKDGIVGSISHTVVAKLLKKMS
jgi:transposase